MTDAPSSRRATYGLVGQQLEGRYRIVELCGSGGQGVVYRAHHVHFDAPIAVKLLKLPTHQSQEARERTLERFATEGKIAFRLASLHSAIVRPMEVGTAVLDDGIPAPYLVMEWLEGCSLRDYLASPSDRTAPRAAPSPRRLSAAQALTLLDPVVEALGLVHEHGVCHRDLKPSNIFLALQSGRVHPRLLDFGIAKMVRNAEASWDTETTGFTAFTPAFAAPEQCDPRLGPTGPWTDVHALAVLLVSLLVGEVERPATWNSHSRQTRPELAVIPDPLWDVLLRSVAVEPLRRPPDANAFWREVREALAPVKVDPSWLQSQDLLEAVRTTGAAPPARISSAAPTSATSPARDLSTQKRDETGTVHHSVLARRSHGEKGWSSPWSYLALGTGALLAGTMVLTQLSANDTTESTPLSAAARGARQPRATTSPLASELGRARTGPIPDDGPIVAPTEADQSAPTPSVGRSASPPPAASPPPSNRHQPVDTSTVPSPAAPSTASFALDPADRASQSSEEDPALLRLIEADASSTRQ